MLDPSAPQLTLTHVTNRSVEIPSFHVTAISGAGVSVSKQIDIRPLVVGTSPECDLSVKDPCVSRRHCELLLTDRGVILRDLGSKNGTFVGDAQIMEGLLTPGMIATLGKSTRLALSADATPTVVPLSPSVRFGEAVGGSVPMRSLFEKLERVAVTAETVLLLGESGTGKEVLARAIHDASPRKSGPFVVLDCSAVAPSLVESEIFGHVRGAFTGADKDRDGLLVQAHQGTLFIDEIGELPIDLQPKLLRALESRTIKPVGGKDLRSFDARIVAATHRDLPARIGGGFFREDLYYRLAVVEVRIPPLRERKDDIPLLVERFLDARSPPRKMSDLPPNAMALLMAHGWPGNVRELRNTVARFMLFGTDAFAPSDRPSRPPSSPRPSSAPPPSSGSADPIVAAPRAPAPFSEILTLPLREARELVVEQFEKTYVTAKLREQGGNVTRAAKAMGVSRQFVHKLMERYGIRGHDL